jgi:hypothetical protein
LDAVEREDEGGLGRERERESKDLVSSEIWVVSTNIEIHLPFSIFFTG